MKLELVQCLRGAAALMVVFFHFAVFLEPVIPGSGSFFSSGYLGVDIFFVISGFIIYVSTTQEQSRNGKVFLIRRLCRVVLPAWAAMAVSVAVQPPLFKDLLLGLMFIPTANVAPPAFGFSFLIVAWTLTYELLFYGVFGAVLFTAAGRKHRGLIVSATLIGIVAVVQLLTQTMTLDAQAGPVVQFHSRYFPFQLISLLGNPILLEFVVGIFLGWVYSAGYFRRTTPLAASVLGAFGVFLVLYFQFRPGHGLSCGGLFAVSVVVYVLAMQGWWDRTRLHGAQKGSWESLVLAAIFIGDISYSLYLIHPSVKGALTRLSAPGAKLTATTSWNFAIALVITFLISVLFYRWIELPAQQLGRFIAARARAAHALAV